MESSSPPASALRLRSRGPTWRSAPRRCHRAAAFLRCRLRRCPSSPRRARLPLPSRRCLYRCSWRGTPCFHCRRNRPGSQACRRVSRLRTPSHRTSQSPRCLGTAPRLPPLRTPRARVSLQIGVTRRRQMRSPPSQRHRRCPRRRRARHPRRHHARRKRPRPRAVPARRVKRRPRLRSSCRVT